jgi:3-dehydroquinate synthase
MYSSSHLSKCMSTSSLRTSRRRRRRGKSSIETSASNNNNNNNNTAATATSTTTAKEEEEKEKMRIGKTRKRRIEPAAIVKVELNDQKRSYPIYVGENLLEMRADLIKKHIGGETCMIVTNETIAPLYLERLKEALHSSESDCCDELRIEEVILPDGEEFKTLECLDLIFAQALEKKLDRKTTFIALGGGVIGDMCGFAASAYQRGVNFIQIPTTVMAMVDSSVGGKTGVNHLKGKNMIGAFYQPKAVLIDIATLKTLPEREYNSGIAEVIKYGLIKDKQFFEWIEENSEALLKQNALLDDDENEANKEDDDDDDENMKNVQNKVIINAIKKSCENKASVVQLDELESGLNLRATLNLGHTFGHAIETGMGYGEYLHGEAVSIGTAMACDLSVRLGWIDVRLQERTINLFKKFNLPTEVPKKMTPDLFMRLMAVDKKNSNGRMNFILLKGELGSCVFTGDFDQSKLKETLDHFCSTK